jgi:hypothetical protein
MSRRQTVARGADGSSPSLFTTASDLSKLAIEVRVDQDDATRLASGMKATFTVDAYLRHFPGERAPDPRGHDPV